MCAGVFDLLIPNIGFENTAWVMVQTSLESSTLLPLDFDERLLYDVRLEHFVLHENAYSLVFGKAAWQQVVQQLLCSALR